MVKYIWMYMLMGLICNTGMAIGVVIYFYKRLNWDTDALEKLMDEAFFPEKGMSHLWDSLDHKSKFKCLLISYSIWPANVATIASRIPICIEWIDDYLERGS